MVMINNIMPAANKKYISIVGLVLTRKSAVRNNGIGFRQEYSPQYPTLYGYVR